VEQLNRNPRLANHGPSLRLELELTPPASPHYFLSDAYVSSLSTPEQAELLLEDFAKRAMEEESAAYQRYKQFTDAAEGVFDARCA
jgi:hypothetical protein